MKKRLPVFVFGLFICFVRALTQTPDCLAQTAEPKVSMRIVSLSPSITYAFQQMGLDSLVVGRTSYCPKPLTGGGSTIIGNVLEINLEEILLLKPDVVFGMAFTKPDALNKLKSLGIVVKYFETPRDFDEICAQVLEMARLSGVSEAAEKTVAAEKRRVDEICRTARERLRDNPYKKVFFQIGERPIFPVIENTYMNQYLTMLGLENIVKNYKGGGISREYVLGAKPDIMLISRMSGMGERVMRDWMTYTVIPAVEAGRVRLVDDDKACCPTPLFFRLTLEDIANYLYSL